MAENIKRDQTRVTKRFPVYFGVYEARYLGFIKNLSLGGVAISSKTIYSPGTTLNLLITWDPEPIPLKGAVRWSSDMSQKEERLGAILDMGVMFTERHPRYLELLQSAVESFSENRREPRFEKVFRVSFESPRELFEEYTQNISAGGMFVTTEHPTAVNSVIEVHILLMEIQKVAHVEARVVHVVAPEQAKAAGMNPGIGVQFTRFFKDDEKMFLDYINSLKAKYGAG
ncbi:MAG: hypothetical protein C4523_15860 [Myxococcales bacterium]|nr:MAG: hypothetical protein C4523_15860 [Myxococcales bacterium]